MKSNPRKKTINHSEYRWGGKYGSMSFGKTTLSKKEAIRRHEALLAMMEKEERLIKELEGI